MFRKEVKYTGGNSAVGSDYLEIEIRYYVLGILIYKISKTEIE